MVGSMFTIQLNNHLKDLKGSKEDFSGSSIERPVLTHLSLSFFWGNNCPV